MNKLLRESGIPFEKVNYYTAPLSREKLAELLRKMNLAPRDLLRKSEAVYRELELESRTLTDDELISLMVEHPDLIQRPIIERGERAVLVRPVENVRALLSDDMGTESEP